MGTLSFTASNYTAAILGIDVHRGTYTVSGTTITGTITWISPTPPFGGQYDDDVYVGAIWTFTIVNNNRLRCDDNPNEFWVRTN